jgi:hypothetical protein
MEWYCVFFVELLSILLFRDWGTTHAIIAHARLLISTIRFHSHLAGIQKTCSLFTGSITLTGIYTAQHFQVRKIKNEVPKHVRQNNWWTGFRFTAPNLWNKLPILCILGNTKSLQTYKSLLKAHLFAAAFGDNSAWEYPMMSNLSA